MQMHLLSINMLLDLEQTQISSGAIAKMWNKIYKQTMKVKYVGFHLLTCQNVHKIFSHGKRKAIWLRFMMPLM